MLLHISGLSNVSLCDFAQVRSFRTQMKAAGFTIAGDDTHAICPVMLGDARLASEFADAMLARGIYVIGFSFPVVPKGQVQNVTACLLYPLI